MALSLQAIQKDNQAEAVQLHNNHRLVRDQH